MRSRHYGRRMRDGEVVATIVAGDPSGLAEAYDRYAAPLYTYCRSLLREPADAADAVQDTFVIAASKLAGLRDRNRLRPWLYAVARNECLRRIRAREATSALEEAPEVTDETADVSGDAERAELRALVRAAILGLNPGEQEVLELQLRQGLDSAEVADVLGVSRNHAHALMSRARDQLETALGVLLVTRAGRQDCPALDELLAGWNGELTPLVRKRVNRHIERCPVCTERRRRELRPAMLLGIAPIAALPLAAAALPAGLKDQVLGLATGNGPDAVAYRAAVGQRAGSFGHHGFPKPLNSPRPWWRGRHAQAAAAATAAAVAAAVIAAALIGGTHHAGPLAGGTGPGAPGVSGGAGGGHGGQQPGQHGPSGQPGATATVVGTQGPGPSPTPGTSASPTTGPSPTGPPTASPSGPGPSPSSPGPSTTRPPPPPSSPPPTKPPTTSPPPPPPRQGTLAVSPTTVVLTPLLGSAITLTAENGPVNWSISEPSSLLGELVVSPASGTLASGQSTEVTISVSGLASLDTHLTANPGGVTITVLIGVGLLSAHG
jgi:RNA polymerase sigma factor (sigma-70 family)